MARRQSIHLKEFSHENPVPAACRLDGLLFTGAIHGGGRGSDPDQFPDDFAEQCTHMFSRVRDILTTAGGSLDDIVKVSVRLAPTASRSELNRQWCELFPDDGSRPARQVTVGTTKPHILVQCEVVAVLAGSDS
ncbi:MULTISPECIES: RidA family protein [Streptomyces]|uniref:RidA family protein n=1 Tax=Streptomyces lycopersici TaxID=2974589 RepID=UPI0021D3C9D3|nr:RidA family protein [Streptomyces sp. NEAU-383]